MSSFFAIAALAGLAGAAAQEPTEAERAIAAFRVPPGFTVDLFAAEPLLANPVAFHVDERGRVFVAETYRQETEGVPDNRSHSYWLLDDLAARTVEDRAAMYLAHHPEYAEEWTDQTDLVRLLIDSDRDGHADHMNVFADGFSELLDGTGAGLVSRGGTVWYTCIPNLWRLEDADDDGVAEIRKVLHTGYGVRVALRGHDLHGLVFGPDGKLYFSIGDRGYHVETSEGRVLAAPGRGAVFRCEPDGSGLEVFARGLRNPQELAFDAYGNLFTVDNNSDAGDQARLVYVMEDGDCGWNMEYQYVGDRGPWMPERWWQPSHAGQAPFLNPPLANICSGPSGLAHAPGTGLPPEYAEAFFVCDFLGGRERSGVRAFWLEPEGAGFRLEREEEFFGGILATDVAFGPDGRLFVSDWVEGWTGSGKGRLYTLEHQAAAADALVEATRSLLEGGFERMGDEVLDSLLGHRDQRVRQGAQFALTERGPERALPVLLARATGPGTTLARVHAIWGLGQLEGRIPARDQALELLLTDPDGEVRAQAAKLLGETRAEQGAAALHALLADEQPRVRYFAALALGRLGDRTAVEPLAELLRENADRDRFLRHAGVTGLAWIGDRAALLALHDDPSASVRLGAVLALRRLRDPGVAAFLADATATVVTSAARAIYDEPIVAALPAVAALLEQAVAAEDPAMRRAIAAHDLLGADGNLQALAAYARRTDAPTPWRRAALEVLRDWLPSPPTDRVLNRWTPRPPRDATSLHAVLTAALPELLAGAPQALRLVAAQAAGRHRVSACEAALFAIAVAADATPPDRVAALRALQDLEAPSLANAVEAALLADDDGLRAEATEALAGIEPAQAIAVIERAWVDGELRQRQIGVRALADIASPEADALLVRCFDEWLAGTAPAGTALELLEAARQRAVAGAQPFPERIAAWESARDPDDPLAAYAPALEGGDAAAGEALFFGKTEVACQRCHAIEGRGAGAGAAAIGPDLTGVATRLTRRQFLEAVVLPGASISEGFGSVLLDLTGAPDLLGRVVEEDEARVVLLVDREGQSERVEVAKDSIADRIEGGSAMPTNLIEFLDLRELRDLVEFLATRMELP
ncbi:MAG TPA: PVC-type heme-binding CxxCH protein [Planctomycetota bacterium]